MVKVRRSLLAEQAGCFILSFEFRYVCTHVCVNVSMSLLCVFGDNLNSNVSKENMCSFISPLPDINFQIGIENTVGAIENKSEQQN